MKKLMIIFGLAVLLVQPALAQPQRQQEDPDCPQCQIENPRQNRERVQKPDNRRSNTGMRRQHCPTCPHEGPQRDRRRSR